MSARKKIADLLWWSMPSSTDEEAKERTSEILDAFAAEERADERAKTLNEAADVTWERALSAPTTGQRTGLMYVTFALRELAAAGHAPAGDADRATVRFALDGELSAEVTIRFGSQLTEEGRKRLAEAVRVATISGLGFREDGAS